MLPMRQVLVLVPPVKGWDEEQAHHLMPGGYLSLESTRLSVGSASLEHSGCSWAYQRLLSSRRAMPATSRQSEDVYGSLLLIVTAIAVNAHGILSDVACVGGTAKKPPLGAFSHSAPAHVHLPRQRPLLRQSRHS